MLARISILAATGAAAGLLLAFLSARILGAVIYNPSGSRWGLLALVLLFLLLGTTLSCLKPGLRAIRINPAAALRSE